MESCFGRNTLEIAIGAHTLPKIELGDELYTGTFFEMISLFLSSMIAWSNDEVAFELMVLNLVTPNDLKSTFSQYQHIIRSSIWEQKHELIHISLHLTCVRVRRIKSVDKIVTINFFFKYKNNYDSCVIILLGISWKINNLVFKYALNI